MTVWASPHIEHNFYKNAEGEVRPQPLAPRRLLALDPPPDPDDYVFT